MSYSPILLVLVILFNHVIAYTSRGPSTNVRSLLPGRVSSFPPSRLINQNKWGPVRTKINMLASPVPLSVQKLSPHEKLVEGSLKNGFSYVILPNEVPEGRFEAHLEILSGSAHELESQQGMAHLLEHVAYMGSPKRQLISGTGSRTNAYTDFHHTVFFAACPVNTPDQFWKKPMLPMAFDALLDVMTTKVDEDRLEKERSAVLSEASMVNKMEYRVECQVLGTLHSENRISTRFPIGKIPLIEKWTKEEVQTYHSMHYVPENVILYVVGDVDVKTTIDLIEQKFGNLKSKNDSRELIIASGEYPKINMNSVSRHFPPVVHDWSCTDKEAYQLVPEALVQVDEDLVSKKRENKKMLPSPTVFNHELLQSFSFHLFAKRPIEPIVTQDSLKRALMRRIALSALQIRFNVQQRQDPLFTFVDFNQLNWPREGCAVCSLDLTADPSSWRDAVKLAVQEIVRLGIHGLTGSELERYKQAILSEAGHAAAQSGQMGNEEVLSQLMEAESCGHTFMHPHTRLHATMDAIDSITVDEVNKVAQELCEHLSHIDPNEGVRPAAIVACVPTVDRNGVKFCVTEADIISTMKEALEEAGTVEALEDTVVPDTLLTQEQLQAKAVANQPSFVPLVGKGAAPGNSNKNKMGVVQRRCSNGVKVNLFSMSDEPQRAGIRMYVPGGRMLENRDKSGSVLAGSRTIQEGGAFLNMTREEVELFCIDHLVMVDIVATEDALIFDFQTVTTPGPGGKVTGLEACMQVIHIIMTDFKYEADAFERARQGFHEHYDSVVKGLESCCQERLAESLLSGDPRFITPNHGIIDSLDLDTSRKAIISQLDPQNVEVSIAGDAPMSYLENLALTYLGTVPSRENVNSVSCNLKGSLEVQTLGRKKQLDVYLPDSDERAMGYLAGPCPNRWGIFADGSTITDALSKLNGGKIDDRRKHPMFGLVLLSVLQEVANRRLFSVVREERRLTYDASFQFNGPETLQGSWYTVSVTSSPVQVQAALVACKEALASLRGTFGITGDSVQSAKRTILNRFRGESASNKFWCENLSGTQSENIPFKTVQCIADFENVLGGISVNDVQQLVEVLNFSEENMTTVRGIAGAEK